MGDVYQFLTRCEQLKHRYSFIVSCYVLRKKLFLGFTTVIPFFADCQKQSAKALKQVAKDLPTALHVAVDKEHVAKNSSAKKPLPPVKRKAVGKGNVRRCEMTERIPFADCHAAGGKGSFHFF